MNSRLEPRPGEWIDRNRRVAFSFEGATHEGFEGDVLASALWASGARMLGRSFKYHRPRGAYSLANHDANALVEDVAAPHRTNLRADVLPIAPGLNVRAVNTVGGLHGDRLRVTELFGRFMPVGFYYKAFHTPRQLFPFYERLMRRVAGLGTVREQNRAAVSPKDYAFCDLVVVGAGPAGLAAALAAAGSGVRVMVVDEQPRAGGSLLWQWRWGQEAETAGHHLQRLLGGLEKHPNVELRLGTTAGGCYADHWLALFDDSKLTKLRARAMVVAAGCFEQPAVFANNDLPGVLLGSAAQRLMHLYSVKPFERCVVLAANADAYRVALDLAAAGVDVAAVADLRRGVRTTAARKMVRDSGIEVLDAHCIYEAAPGPGKTSIEAAVVTPLDVEGHACRRDRRRIDCDGIVVSVGWTPAGGLLYQAGGRFEYGPHVEQFTPLPLPESVFAAGRVNGVFDLDAQIEDGTRAGLEAVQNLGHHQGAGAIPQSSSKEADAPSHPYPVIAHEKKKCFVDFDEDIHLDDFVHAHQEGYDNIELVKRYTTVGMGPSQGKLSNMNAVRILARLNEKSIDETGTTTSRPFHQPVPLGHLAGRRFHPLQKTPLHAWHAEAGAVFMYAGSWLRPEYYKTSGPDREAAILAEARNVRDNVGMVDVGTLGKILVAGEQAAAFLNRIYTGSFTKQKVQRLRYAMGLDESGVVVEDGIVARLAEDRFYVTATSSGAAGFYRLMQRWALQWGMKVVLANVTEHIAAMNIAGPMCRRVLASMTDVDVGGSSFDYLEVRRGRVADVEASLMRVGFVGELGYEIHVPASQGLHVWHSLMEAGREQGIRPFGVEAQRLLRLEKGHLIVGQDTDALTNPDEASATWAVGRNKPFFVGQRSLQILRKQQSERRLVGLAFSTEHRGPLPDECHLIVEDEEILGRITSVAKRSTLGHPLAMAFVRPDRTKPGTTLKVRLDDGKLVEAKVVTLPFYDPQGERQKK